MTAEGSLVGPDELARLKDKEWMRQVRPERAAATDFTLAIVEDATYEMMAASDVLLTASGTATLEAAILGKPMVIAYRMSRLNLLEYRVLVKKSLPPHIGMPNLIAGRRICPEFVQDEATGENLARERHRAAGAGAPPADEGRALRGDPGAGRTRWRGARGADGGGAGADAPGTRGRPLT